MTLYVWNMLSLGVYAAVVVMVIRTGFMLCSVRISRTLYVPVAAFLIALLCQAGSFLVLQSHWITEDFNSVVGEEVSLGWMLFDYFNAVAMLSFVIGLRTYLGWKTPGKSCDGKLQYRRRADDQP